MAGAAAVSDGAPRPGLDVRLLPAAGCTWAVVLAATGWPAAWCALAAGLALLVALLLGLRRPGQESRVRQVAGLSAACCALGLTAVAGHLMLRETGSVVPLAQARATVRVEAVVSSDPRALGSQGRFGENLVVTRVSVRKVTGRGEVSSPHTPVLVMGGAAWLSVHWHERVAVTGRLAPAEPGDDVEALLYPRGTPRVVGVPGPVTRGIERLRSALRAATRHLPADPRGLVPGLVIGDTGAVPATLTADMRATGMTHLTAVSGSNVTLVMMSVMWLAGWLRVPFRGRMPLALLTIALFVMLCRPDPSVVRAAVMGAVGLLGVSLSRRHSAPAALGAAVVVLLVVDPWLARSYGFALSSLATAGLIFFARPWGARIARALPARAHGLGEAIAIPIAAQAMCAPVIVLLQGGVSLVGVPANILAAPLVAPATFAGVVTVLTAPIGLGIAWLPSWCAGLPAWGIAAIAHSGARVPFGMLPWPAHAPGALLLAALSLTLVLCGGALVHWARRSPWPAAGFVVLLIAAIAPPLHAGWPPPGWVYVACDVGQGDGGVLATTPGHAVLIDTGPDPQHIDDCLGRLGISALDAIVLTHFHADHVGGLSGALHGRTAREIFVTPVTQADSGGPDAIPAEAPMVRRLAAAHDLPVRTLSTADTLSWGTVRARVLWPGRTIQAGSVQNNGSIVLDVRAGGLRLLLAGDIEREAGGQVRRELERMPSGPPFDVLKVAHHGSSNQDDALVRMIRAPVAVISVGAGNDYGHPAPRTLALLRGSGSVAFRTDRVGDVAVVGSHGHLRVATRR